MDLEGERRVWLRLARTAFELAGETRPAAALAMQGGKFTEARKLLLAAGEGWRVAGRVLKGATQLLLCGNLRAFSSAGFITMLTSSLPSLLSMKATSAAWLTAAPRLVRH